MQWNQFYALNTGIFFDEDILPTGLEFKIDITGRDPSKYSVIGWYYGGQFWKTTDAFVKAANAPGFKKFDPVIDGPFGATDPQPPKLPHDDIYPPTTVQPSGTRYAVDMQQKYVEWSEYLSALRERLLIPCSGL